MTHLEKLQLDFINLRFGTFIHFNSASEQFCKGDIEDWEYDVENKGMSRRYPFDPKDWNPDLLDCRQWARIARSAGVRFSAMTTKHHEGFALWPSAYTEHCVKNATKKTDIVEKYLEAFRAEGIVAGLYFSVLDLTAKIGKTSCSEAQKNMVKGQLTELLTNYGKIPFLMIDGWSAPWGGPSYEILPFSEIDSLVKSLQPDCLVMNIGCTEGIKGTDVLFFENGAGQDVSNDFHGPGILCNKLTPTWFWRTTDPLDTVKSADWALSLCSRCFPMNVNVILNLSPSNRGLVDDNLADEFEKIGQKLVLPKPLTNIPSKWLKREKEQL